VDHAIDEAHQTFRDELASIAPDGRRKWVYARQPAGRFYRRRTVLSWFLLAFLIGAPFVEVGGLPLVLLDVIERRFVLFGLVFWPQDFHLVVLLALTCLVTLALSTAAFGRVWCGWLCPQTIFMEMLFRKIEYGIEGSAEQQVRRKRGPWTGERILRAGAKHAVFFALSFGIANVFLAWIIGAAELKTIVTDPPGQHVQGLAAITVFSFVFYAVFARFREQACLVACPYGRVMSSLIDPETIKVTYDRTRGEPRGKRRAGVPADAASGDCVDCYQCVTVCPTGIDIRNGVQLECLDCTACIDACDTVMTRLGRPRGLIRLTSHRAVTGGASRKVPVRIAAYAGVWLALVALVATLIVRRPALDVLILRQAGTLFTPVEGDRLANFYTVQVFNRTGQSQTFEIVAVEPDDARITPLGPLSNVAPYALLESRLALAVPASETAGAATPVRFEVRTGGRTLQRIESSFVGPASPRGNRKPESGRRKAVATGSR
jgi:cytochrome c oxidase accessory protein FixG